MIFLDTSAVLALADTKDSHHNEAVATLVSMMSSGHAILTHNYVLVESAVLLQNRIGLASSLAFLTDAHRFTIHWISAADHAEAVELLSGRNRRGLSLVDCMSFVVMRKYAIKTALAFDADFEAEGYEMAVQGYSQGRTDQSLEQGGGR